MTTRRIQAERRGHRGERLATWWLRLHGRRIVGQRLRIPVGEVDLVAQRGRTVAFRRGQMARDRGRPRFAIDERRLKRVARAAEALAPRYARNGEDIRIDVLLLAPGHWPRHIANAWQP